MVARTQRSFYETDKKEFLEKLRICRDACVKTCTNAPIHGPEYKAADRLMMDIDNAAEALTGNRKYFLGPIH